MNGKLTLRSIPFRNLRAYPGRTAILLLLAAAQAACMFGALAATGAMRRQLSLSEARLGADLLVYPSQAMSRISADSLLMQGTPVEVWKSRSLLARLAENDEIAAVSVQVCIRDDSGRWIIGFDPETDFVLSPWIQAPFSGPPAGGTLLAGSALAVAEDDTVQLFGRAWPVAGQLDATGSGLDEAVFVDLATLEEIIQASDVEIYEKIDPKADFSLALIRLKDRSEIESVNNWINTRVRKVKAVRSEAALTDAASGIRGQLRLTVLVAGCAWAILLLALGIAQAMMLRERRREIHVWRVIGASRALVGRMLLREAVGVSAMGGLLGVLLAAPAAWVAHMPLPSALGLGLLTVVLSAASGGLGAHLAVGKLFRSEDAQMLLSV